MTEGGESLLPLAIVVFATFVALVAAIAGLIRSGRVPGVAVRRNVRSAAPRGARP